MQEFTNNLGDIKQVISQAKNREALERKMNDLQSKMLGLGYKETKRKKIGRNDECPCGSGNKFKRCCINEAAPDE